MLETVREHQTVVWVVKVGAGDFLRLVLLRVPSFQIQGERKSENEVNNP